MNNNINKELRKAKKNIFVSKAISKYPGKSPMFEELLDVFSNIYSIEAVKKALDDLYYKTMKEPNNLKALTIWLIKQNSKLDA